MKKTLLIFALLLATIACREQDSICVTMTEAGTLASKLPADQAARFDVLRLKVVGPINSTDIGYIRAMAGNSVKGEATEGSLRVLDLSEAKIVKGGNVYWTDPADSYETSFILRDNTIGYDMFRECKSQRTVVLPEGITKICDGAFTRCSHLSSVNVQSTVTQIGEGYRYCTSLMHHASD